MQHLFQDLASGAKDDRAGLAQVLESVCPGDVLVVWKLDRLSRSLSHMLAIVNSLKEKGVAFRLLIEGMDTTAASGELLFHVFGARAVRTCLDLGARCRRNCFVVLKQPMPPRPPNNAVPASVWG